MKKLANKVAVITGGSSGIGLSRAILYAEQGAKVVITGRDQSSIDAAVAAIGHGAIGLASDVSSLENIDKLYKTINEKLGNIDVLVINAGVIKFIPAKDITEEDFDYVSDINFKGLFFSVQRALPYLKDGASVILTGSSGGEKAMVNASVYGATKAAVRSLARSFSAELADRRIRVNVLSPGPIETPIFGRHQSKEAVDDLKDYLKTIVPAGRLGKPEEIAEGFLYLASDDSRYMLGGELVIDGGARPL
jgi:NAD(P)-dependent dehydrogenase (short-subunit alcohol dehydrogenase family)